MNMDNEVNYEELAKMVNKSASRINVSLGFCHDVIDALQQIFVIDRPEALEIVKKITGDILRLEVRDKIGAE